MEKVQQECSSSKTDAPRLAHHQQKLRVQSMKGEGAVSAALRRRRQRAPVVMNLFGDARSFPDSELLRCPKCFSRMEAQLLEFDAKGYQTVWWTCSRSSPALEGGSCTFPLTMPSNVYWLRRSPAEVRSNTVPRPNIKNLPPKYHHLYPGIFGTSELQSRHSTVSRSDGVSVASSGSDLSRVPTPVSALHKGRAAVKRKRSSVLADADARSVSSRGSPFDVTPPPSQFSMSRENSVERRATPPPPPSPRSAAGPRPTSSDSPPIGDFLQTEAVQKTTQGGQSNPSIDPALEAFYSHNIFAKSTQRLAEHSVPRPGLVKNRTMHAAGERFERILVQCPVSSIDTTFVPRPDKNDALTKARALISVRNAEQDELPSEVVPMKICCTPTRENIVNWKQHSLIDSIQRKKFLQKRLDCAANQRTPSRAGEEQAVVTSPGISSTSEGEWQAAQQASFDQAHDYNQQAELIHIESELQRKLWAKMERYNQRLSSASTTTTSQRPKILAWPSTSSGVPDNATVTTASTPLPPNTVVPPMPSSSNSVDSTSVSLHQGQESQPLPHQFAPTPEAAPVDLMFGDEDWDFGFYSPANWSMGTTTAANTDTTSAPPDEDDERMRQVAEWNVGNHQNLDLGDVDAFSDQNWF